MEVLRIKNDHFTLAVNCNWFHTTFRKAQTKQPDLLHASAYSFTSGTCEIFLPGNNSWGELTGAPAHPVFFENKDYHFWIEFKDGWKPQNAGVHADLKEIQDKFLYKSNAGVLTGTINYGNDIGKSELNFWYEINGTRHEYHLGYDVFPIKLDYNSDYKNILTEIQEEYPLLVLDFLKKTYHSFKPGEKTHCDVIWWQIFGGIFDQYTKAAHYILNKPHRRLQKKDEYVIAERIKSWSPAIEEEFHANRLKETHKYHVTNRHLSVDTPENRFFKFATREISNGFARISSIIENNYAKDISAEFQNTLGERRKLLQRQSSHPFLRSIGDFSGFRQESLVLQKATGYNTVYKCWYLLRLGFSFLDGVQKLELKNIADLYQIWCFLKVKQIVKSLLGNREPKEVELAKIKVDKFIIEFRKGEKSRVAFVNDNGDLIEIYHDYQFSEKAGNAVRSFTVPQRPDIVVQITKNDLRDRYMFTYLYDAKYRLESDEDITKADVPPADAINQMHRYRDAVFFNTDGLPPQKEVIGGYILFPGSGSREAIEKADYSVSIRNVNIGAFPLRPGDNADGHQDVLRQHLKGILYDDSDKLLNVVIPHKGNSYEVVNPKVLIGIVKTGAQTRYLEESNDSILKYHTGKFEREEIDQFIRINGELKYFAPKFSGKGVNSFFTITDIQVIPRNEIFEEGHPLHNKSDSSERVVFYLKKRTILKTDGYYDSSVRLYGYCTLKNLRNPVSGKLETLKWTM